MGVGNATVVKARKGWRVELSRDGGERQAFACAHEAQARFFAAVLELGPSTLPDAFRQRAVKQKGQRRQRARAAAAPAPTAPADSGWFTLELSLD